MQTKVSILFNEVFKYIVFFCLYFLWISYYVRGLLICTLLAVVATSLTCFFLTKIFINLKTKKQATLAEKKEISVISRNLLFLTHKELLEYFTKILNKTYSVKNKGTALLVNGTLFMPLYHKTVIEEDAIINILKLHSEEKKIVLAGISFSDAAKNIAKTLGGVNLVFLNQEQVYFNIIKKNKILPPQKFELKKESKPALRELARIAFNRRNAKGYFFSGIVLLIGSYFIRFGLYYIISSTVLFVLSLFCLFNETFNRQEPDLFN